MKHLLPVVAYLTASLALAQVPAVAPPRVVVLSAEPGASPDAAKALRRALADRGATVVDPPARLPPAAPDALARSLGVDGVIELAIVGDAVAGRAARLVVTDPTGERLLDGTLPLGRDALTSDESGALAAMAIQALAPSLAEPTPPRTLIPSDRPPGVPNVAGAPPPANPKPPKRSLPPDLAPAVPTQAPPLVPVLPAPGVLHLGHLWGGPSLSWRTQGLTTTEPGPGLDFGSSNPYAGLALGGDFFPFGGVLHDRLGFSAAYSFSALRLHVAGEPSARATEHQARAEVIGRFPGALGGDLGVRVGVAYEGFLTPPSSSVVTSTHLSPRLGLDWERPLVGPVRLTASAGVRPFVRLGSDLRRAYGSDASSTGLDAAIGLNGPTPLAGVRWTAGYDYLRYEDRLAASDGRTQQVTSVHRLGLGLSWESHL